MSIPGSICSEIDLKQSRLSAHSQCSVKILNIAQIMANGYCVIITERIIDHIIMYPMIYLVSLYLQDLLKYYRLKSVYFLDTLHMIIC